MNLLHVALHDVSPARESEIRAIHEKLRKIGISRYSMLVVPRWHGGKSLDDSGDFRRWLAGLARQDVEMVLHGFSHERRGGRRGPVNALRELLFTRGEGEFTCISRDEAQELISRGRSQLSEMLEVEVDAFAAPAWLYGRGTMEALAALNFRRAESRWRIWDPSTGRTLVRRPVINYAGGGWLKRNCAAAWVSLACGIYSRRGVVRIAVHPEDFSRGRERELLIRLKALAEKGNGILMRDL